MSRIGFHGLLTILAALFLFPGCSDEPCDACQTSGGCPNLSGIYDVDLQVGIDDCGFMWGNGYASFHASQTQVNAGEDNEWAQLSVSISQGYNYFSVQGKLCDTRDDASPLSYTFNGASRTGSSDYTTDYAVGGRFIVDTNTDICASMTITDTIRDGEGEYESCSISALIYTRPSLCE
jgi:hypothetical protein